MRRTWPRPPDDRAIAELLDEGAQRLLGLGLGGTVLGIWLTWALWETGWVVSTSFVLLIGGVGALLAGLAAARHEWAGRRAWPDVRRRYRSILNSLAACEPTYRARLGWLHDHGITHRLLCKHLLGVVSDSMRDVHADAGPESPPPPLSIAHGGAQTESAPPPLSVEVDGDAPYPKIRELTYSAHQLEEGDLARFERRQGLTLPMQFKRFLLQNNGGELRPNWFIYGLETGRREAHVRVFYSLGVTGPRDIDTLCSAERERMAGRAPEMLPIALTDKDEHVCIALTGEHTGAIYLSERDATVATPLAGSLFTFLSSLTWKPGTEPPPAPTRRRYR